jgi:hypothetical protein
MSRVTKAQKRNRSQTEAKHCRRLRSWTKSRRHRPRVLKRPPKWMRHLARRDPQFEGLRWKPLGGGALAGVKGGA